MRCISTRVKRFFSELGRSSWESRRKRCKSIEKKNANGAAKSMDEKTYKIPQLEKLFERRETSENGAENEGKDKKRIFLLPLLRVFSFLILHEFYEVLLRLRLSLRTKKFVRSTRRNEKTFEQTSTVNDFSLFPMNWLDLEELVQY